MKKILWPLLLLIFFGCEKESDNKIDFGIDSTRFLSKETSVLLSIKYGMKDTPVDSLIYDYKIAGDPVYRFLLGYDDEIDFDLLQRVDFRKTIDELSTKYKIDKETIASILIDRILIRGCRQ